MRLSSYKAFDKHLAAAAPHHLNRIYLIASADEFERRQALDAALTYVAAGETLITHLLAKEPLAVLDALNSPSLLGGEPVVVVEEVDKKFIDALGLKEPLAFGYLFLLAKSKCAAPFVEMHGVIVDMTEEKPWDKERRLQEMLYEKAESAGKRLQPEAALLLATRLDKDAAVLMQEMDKLLCYAGDRPTIERADVEAIAASSRTHTLWQIAEDFVWEKTLRATSAEMSDVSFFHGLIAAARQQLWIGLKMHALHESGVPFAEWSAHFPKIWPKALEKKGIAAQQLGAAYFRKGLDQLFELEQLSKSSSLPTDALLDLLRLKFLTHKKS